MSTDGEMTPGGVAALRPVVAARGASRGFWLVSAGGAALGLAVFLWLSGQRHAPSGATVQRTPTAPSTVSAVPPPPEFAPLEAAARGQTQQPAPAPLPPVLLHAAPPALAPVAPQPNASAIKADQQQHVKSPAMIVDFSAPPPAAPPAPAASASAAKPGAPQAGAKLSGDEQFAERVAAGEPDQARATVLHNLAVVIPQGAIIPAVLETALNSDLPGFARAVVSRDVRGFDGSTVLAPRGSRLIGQYRSGVSQGQARAFVIWTRLIRPDGVSIQIGSPVADTLGRAGLDGKVDRHFFERFGGAILLSVVNAGVTALAGGPSTQVVIGSNQEATGLAATIAPSSQISPTIKVAQGTPLRVFVARDLDFSGVGGAGR